MRALIWTTLLTLCADQASKLAVLFVLDLPTRRTVEVWEPFITFHMAWNTGVNFGLFSSANARWMLISLAIAVCLLVLWWVIRDKGGRLMQISAGLLIGGAVGNVVDRIWHGAVADFLNVTCCGIENPYAFNIADIAIFVGAVGLVLIGDGGKTRKGRKAA